MKSLGRRQALSALGLQDGASQEDIRRAFRQLALQYHPDKNLGAPEAAAEQFKQLLRAYQRLTTSRHADTAWEDLELADVLTEEFLDEALAQQMPAFEMMFMQHHLSTTQQQQQSSISCWADDNLGDASGAMQSAMWRKIYTSLQKKRAQHKQSGTHDSPSHQSTPPQASSTRLREARRWLLWEFVSDLILREDASEPHSTGYANRWQQPAGSCSNSSRPAYSSDDSDVSSDISSDVGESYEQRAARRAERRLQYRQRLQTDRQAQQHQHQQNNHKDTSSHYVAGPPAIDGAEQGSADVRSHIACTEPLTHATAGCRGQQDMQGGGEGDVHAAMLASASETVRPDLVQEPQIAHQWSLALADSVQDDGQQGSQQYSNTNLKGPDIRQPRWLTGGNCWLWLKRILLLKALSMLWRP